MQEADWPEVDAIIGNPPFLGDKMMISELGENYTAALRTAYQGKVPGGADFVLFWVLKGLEALNAGRVARVGFVTTNSVRGGANRRILDRIADGPGFVSAWDDEPWTVEGAAVRVSMIVFGKLRDDETAKLDGAPVLRINADLTASEVDLTRAVRMRSNLGIAYQGPVKVGPFDIPGDQARDCGFRSKPAGYSDLKSATIPG